MFGKIHVYYEDRGYGFISVNFRERRFFHVENYHGAEVPTAGMRVEFDLAPAIKPGLPDHAVRIIPAPEVEGAR